MALEQVGGVEQKSGISRLTLEHLFWKVESDNDLTSATAAVAFAPNTALAKPVAQDFVVAEIVPDPDDPLANAVRLLVGPAGDKDLTPATDDPVTYRVWVRINILGAGDVVQQSIVRSVGTLLVR